MTTACEREMRQMGLLKPEASLSSPGYMIKTTTDEGGAAFTVYKDEIPLVLCVLAMDADDASYWNGIENRQRTNRFGAI